MPITGKTKTVAVLGHPIRHTLSPPMHNAAFKATGLDVVYLPFDVEPHHLMQVIDSMRRMGFLGTNLTLPLKEVAYQNLKQVDDNARQLEVVNTIAFTEEGPKGYNTDADGFLDAVHESFDDVISSQHVHLMGAGGSAQAVAMACGRAGATSISLTNRTHERGMRLAEKIKLHFPNLPVEVTATETETTGCVRKASLVVNTTTVGMQESDPPLLEPSAFHRDQCVMDLIYTHARTSFLKPADEAGAQTVNGMSMLLHQGARSFTIWTGQPAPVEVMREALQQELSTR